MKLTGKCKEEFYDWYFRFCEDFELYPKGTLKSTLLLEFSRLTDSMKWGVYQDYFDSVKIDIDDIYKCEEFEVCHRYQDSNNHRPEIRIHTIEKANELRNEMLNG